MKLYILEHDARVNASRDSIKEGFDQSVIVFGGLYAVVASDNPDYLDDYTVVAIYSSGKCVHNPTYFERM